MSRRFRSPDAEPIQALVSNKISKLFTLVTVVGASLLPTNCRAVAPDNTALVCYEPAGLCYETTSTFDLVTGEWVKMTGGIPYDEPYDGNYPSGPEPAPIDPVVIEESPDLEPE